MVEVTQEDRLAAGAFACSLVDMQEIFNGKADGLPVVQAFALHRIASEQRGYERGLREAAENLEALVTERNRLKLPKMATAIIRQCAARITAILSRIEKAERDG